MTPILSLPARETPPSKDQASTWGPVSLDQSRAPLLDAVREVARLAGLRLHTPAHQGCVDPEFADLMGPAIAADLTELDQTDDLRDPHGPIAQAETLAADFWQADRTFFLVGGASVGNMAALLAVRKQPRHGRRGRPPKIVIGRNAHVSAVSGLVLADWEPIWVPARWDTRWGVAMPPDAEAFALALAEHPEAAAVFVTAPGYFGDACSTGALREVAGNRPLIVDEAHGSHVPRAIAEGADVVVHSAHKGLSGPTQGGYLHVRGERLDPDAVAAALRLLQTTSPNYWILAGLDAARRQAALAGDQPRGDPLSYLERTTGLEIRQTDDPTRVLVRFADGIAAYDLLAARGLVAEAALPAGVLLLVGPGSLASLDAIASALVDVRAQIGHTHCLPALPPVLPRHRMSPRRAAMSQSHVVDVRQAVDQVSAEPVCPYPPGIPILVPGEEIDSTAVARLAAIGVKAVTVVRPGLASR